MRTSSKCFTLMALVSSLFVSCVSVDTKSQVLIDQIDRTVLTEYEKALDGLPIVGNRKIDELTITERMNRKNSIEAIRMVAKTIRTIKEGEDK